MPYNSDVSKKRGCGFKKIGGLYLCGDYIPVSCDRLPYLLEVCPVCGHGLKTGRGMTKINPLKLFGKHEDCHDKPGCYMCDPKELGYVMRVGEKFYKTPEDFLYEGVVQGFSKRIAQIPKDFKVGETVVYLTHRKACDIIDDSEEPELPKKLLDTTKYKKAEGIFTAFIPQRIEKIYWQSALDSMPAKERASLERRGITPVGVPDGDENYR